VERQDFYKIEDIINDVKYALDHGPRPDVITFAGSGDPTLYRSLGKLIDALHDLENIPVLLLTNGATLYLDEVAKDACKADILVPSLDAADESVFQQINRPHKSIAFTDMLEGVQNVAKKHPNRFQLEVLIAESINDSADHLSKMAQLLPSIEAASIDINTAIRPAPGCKRSYKCSPAVLEEAKRLFGKRAEIIADYSGRRVVNQYDQSMEAKILNLISRRPCSLDDINVSLGFSLSEIEKVIEKNLQSGLVEERAGKDKNYYFLSSG
jgi:wyosine [tRNA(Phe)-imidazoG37] synthetase (radical SAM superfamily)